MPCFNNPIVNNVPKCNVIITDSQQILSKQELLSPQYSTQALLDTGATHSCITDQLAKKLKFKPMSNVINITNTTETQTANIYKANLSIPIPMGNNNVHLLQFPKISLTEISHSPNNSFEIIIGMDIISLGHLTIAGRMLHFSL